MENGIKIQGENNEGFDKNIEKKWASGESLKCVVFVQMRWKKFIHHLPLSWS